MRVLTQLFLVLVCCVLSCTSGTPPGAALVHASRGGPLQAVPLPAGGLELPAPSTLAQQLPARAAQRQASYVPADLFRQAELPAAGMPAPHITLTAGGALFEPAYAGGSSGFGDLAFALYDFGLADYGGDTALHLNWIAPAPASGELWIALADFAHDRWDWFAPYNAALANLPEFTPYLSPGHDLLLCVLRTGSAPSELDWLRIGSIAPNPALALSPDYGLAPLAVSLDASASSDPDGSIAEYLWDPEGDGSFDVSTGAEPLLDWEYPAAGEFSPAVRTVDDDGVADQAAAAVSVVDAACFSYGTTLTAETPNAVVVCSDGHLLLFGYRYEKYSGINQALIAKLAPDGTADFVRAWDGPATDMLYNAVLAGDGYVYACGQTYSYGQGSSDGLVQKWSQDGELLWSKTVGSAGMSEDFSAIAVSPSGIFVCGSTFLQTGIVLSPLVVRLDLDGNLAWTRSLITPGQGSFLDLQYSSTIAVGDTAVRACGYYDTDSSTAVEYNALFAGFTESGERVSCLSWGGSAQDESAEAVLVRSKGFSTTVVIAGTAADNSVQYSTFLSELGGASEIITAFATDGLKPLAMVRSSTGFNLVLSRYVSSGSNSIAVGSFDFALALLEAKDIGAWPDGACRPLDAAAYGPAGLVVSGTQTGPPPQESEVVFDINASANTWVDYNPGQEIPAFIVQDTPTDLIELSDFAFNREATDGDALVCLTH